MKKIYFLVLTFLISSQLSSQNFTIDQNLIAKEKSAFMKMPVGNYNTNSQNYDLRYQRLDVSLDPAVQNISGSVTSHFIPNQSLSSIFFDFTDQLTVSQVSYHGIQLTFQQLATKELKIDFPTSLSATVLDSLTIHYSGIPNSPYNSFNAGSQNSNPILATLNEPYGAQDWFPTKQSLDDKIEAFDFKITTPSQYNVAANGKLMSETILPNNQKLTYWRTQYPMTAYLVAFSITNFTKINDVIGNPPFPFVNYVYPTTATNTAVMNNIEWTKQCMILFEQKFGVYPFRNEKYGHMEFHYNGVCMEHQTMSSMSSWGKYVIAHELAHQWFGDKVTCKTWNDIWINEGFATFGEHLANEELIMSTPQFLNYLNGQINYITSQPGGSTYVADADLGSVGAIFNGRLSYAKGGYILRMIKWILGDSAFYSSIQDYHNRPNLAYNYASTTDLKNSLLISTGQDFTEFFNDWLYGQGYPTYDIRWKQNANQSITFQVNQTQSHASVSFFEMPLPIKVTGTGGQTEFLRLENSTNGQYFNLPLNFDVASVEFNYEYQMLERNSTVTEDNTLSTDEIKLKEFVIYPNPVKDEIFIKGLNKKHDFEIHSADGRLVKKSRYNFEAINISELVPGVYFLSIAEEKFKFIKK